MNNSIFKELKDKMVRSGSSLNLFLGINILTFLALKLVRLAEWLLQSNTGIASWITDHLIMPPYPPSLLYKFWTPVTYMFVHEQFFHILFNLLALYWFGRIFEDFLNKRQFLFTYFAGGIAGALLFILTFNLLPALSSQVAVTGSLIGASAAVMAIVVATATLLPDYAIMLLFFGEVRLKYLVIVFVLLDLIGIIDQPGTSFAHLGGAILGFVYIKQLQSGNDWSKLFQKRKRKLKVASKGPANSPGRVPDQEVIDRILDKISRSGYDSLSKLEKEQLFNASKSNETKKR